MPYCSFHPKVETEVGCAECGRWICPKDMVDTPVGYKCKICARPARGQLVVVRPKQWLGGTLAGLGVGIAGGLFLTFAGVGFFLIPMLWGALVGEAVRRGSGGHRGGRLIALACGCVLVGTLPALVFGAWNPFVALFGCIGAAGVLGTAR